MSSKQLPLLKFAFLNALGTFLYIGLIAFVLFQTQKGPEIPGFLMPVIVLTLFVISATITGSLVLGRPIYLIATKNVRDGITLLISTVVFLALFVGAVALSSLHFIS